ncbi:MULTISPECIES: MerR family transcriptional regulator [Clostridium]|jgi:Predicted transcriptional regulators|uniref:DNA-binding transcriptional MerR regulator n=3 Tax=Clostridium beijerinckii TaxID=1520 RepID=A0A1S8RAH8_CLOBE|nr:MULTISPECIES: MerR family transcriptional regulator [Clostridium]ABR35437.1 putative transcriptional regulator, MerR family [Clostridium beijerinckii NCIMB 8052]AIU03643.1 MerR family transcriptional regulator [Clostridium beijerinckii ATCC 35702]ALB45514.1 MerR family transcriptional regulator [Clostridium beijerinckii NRRL B-598]AQS06083.1 HTH-type transcriptional regulator AdhR [Clostridium beijerinckii]MBA2886119.1 DNA-binding transcriptional MerR regulator [Clostridium beijerinckii]
MKYSMKEVSEKFNITPYTLRYYEREGLLPFVQRDNNGRRIYTDVDLGSIQLVNCMRATGMSIAYIKNYVSLTTKGKDTVDERRNIMLEQKEILKEEIKKYNDLLELVNMKLDYYDEKISRDELKEIITERNNKN